MDQEHLRASIRMSDGLSQYIAEAGALPPVTVDTHPPVGGGNGYTPLELLLISLISCTSMTTGSLLRDRMRRQVTDIKASGDGVLRETHPQTYETIDVHLEITSPDATEAEVARALKSAEEKVCPVWAMLKGNVDIRTTFELKR